MSTSSCPVESASPAVRQWVLRKFPFLRISSSWSTWNFHDVRWRTEVFHFLVILVHLEIHGVLHAGAMLHVQDGYTQCWKVRVSLRHVGRHSTRYWQHTCHRRFHPPLGTLLTQEHTGYTGANAMAICPSRRCIPSGTKCWHSFFHSSICPLVIYHKCLVAVVVKPLPRWSRCNHADFLLGELAGAKVKAS